MSELVKTKYFEKIMYDWLLEAGLQIPDNPIAACKLGLQQIKDRKEEQFIKEVLEDLKKIDLKDIQVEKSLAKLYKSLQVIAKATTQEKINRFKKLTVNGIIYQNSTSENDYDLYLRLVDELNDSEFLVLNYLLEITIPNGKDKNIKTFYSKTGIDRQKLKSFLQRLESFGVAEEERLINTVSENESCFSRPVIVIEPDDYPIKKIPKYYKISELGSFLLNFISLEGQ